MKKIFIIVFLFSSVFAEDLKTINLPNPQINIGRPLMKVLSDRKTSRNFGGQKLSLQHISNLLWAACGINRKDSGKRTAPTAMNCQEIDVYVSMAEGLYLYDAKANSLIPVSNKDIRALTGDQPFVAKAPLNLIFVSDYSKIEKMTDEQKIFYSATDTGFISQNVYLYCASERLATVVRGMINKPELEKAMNLKSNQKIILAQTVGYPAMAS